MNRGETVLAGVAGLAVVGLLALTARVIASWVTGSDAAERPSAATTSTHAPAPTDTPLPTSAATATADPGDGEYQSVGDGLVIPAQGSGGCSTWAAIHPYGEHDASARLRGTITDLGSRTFATGAVGLDDDGQIATYTVASGDTGYGIGDRLCIDYITLLAYNGKFAPPNEIQPGDVLILRP